MGSAQGIPDPKYLGLCPLHDQSSRHQFLCSALLLPPESGVSSERGWELVLGMM